MRRTLADIVAFGRQFLRSPMWAFFTFVFPVLLILLFGALFSTSGTSTIPLAVQDQDHSAASAQFLSVLNATHTVSVTFIDPTANLSGYIRDHSLTAALQIPHGFGDRTAAHLPVNVSLYGDPSSSTFGILQGVVNAAVVHMNYLLNQATPVVGMESATVASPSFTFMDYFLPGILGMTVMTSAMYSMTSVTAQYRNRRYFQLLATTPLGKGRWLASKIVFYLILLTLSLFVTVAVGYAAFGTHVTIGPVAFALVAAGVVLFTGLGMLIGVLAKDPEGAIAIANVIGFPMMFLAGTFWSLSSVPTYLQVTARALPLTYLNDGLRDAMVYSNWTGAYTDLAIVAALGVAAFVVAARFISWKDQ